MDIKTSGNRLGAHSEQLALSRDNLSHDLAIQLFTNQISELVAIPTPHFQTLYFSAITGYLSMTQHCPRETIYTRLQTVTDGLKLRRSLVLPIDASPELASEEHDLWTYAVFVSLLIYNIAPEILGYEVVVQKNRGDRFTRWHPLISPLEPPNRFKVVGELSASAYASLLLMPVIINEVGLQWLSENNRVFHTVLELIASPDPSNRLGALVYQANHLKESKIVETPYSPTDPAPATSERSEITPSPKNPHKNTGVQFRRWLMSGISGVREDKNIVTTARGIALIYPDIFKQYANEQKDMDWEVIEGEFLKLNLHSTNPSTQSHIHHLQVPSMGKKNVMLITSMKKQ
jgi:Putative helicase